MKSLSKQRLITAYLNSIDLQLDKEFIHLLLLELKRREIDIDPWLGHHRLPADERNRNIIADYLEQAYPSGKVVIHEGGRFGKVLIRLQDQNMYTREI